MLKILVYQDMLNQWSILISAWSKFCYWSKMWLNKDRYWFSLIDSDIYLSALVSMPQNWSSIDRHWSLIQHVLVQCILLMSHEVLYFQSSPSPMSPESSYNACLSFKDNACCTDDFLRDRGSTNPPGENFFNHLYPGFDQCGRLSSECRHFIFVSI